MTSALALLLSCIAGAALLIAVGTYFWVNRTPPENERFDKFGRVPLFGADLGGTAPTGTPVAGPSAHGSVPLASGTPALEATPITPTPAAPGAHEAPDRSETPNALAPTYASPPDERVGPRIARPTPTMDTPLYSNPVAAPFPNRTGLPLSNGFANGASANGIGTNGHVPTENFNGHVNADDVPGSMVEGHGLRFSVPAEGTLQFLPGRFEINSGLDAGREIRFVRVPGPDGTQVTFGRNEGPLYRHIQLRDQTVSREHARMTLVEGQWSLANLSRTNPVAHNGRILGFGEAQPLHDGDRVEMGEVVFNFRSR